MDSRTEVEVAVGVDPKGTNAARGILVGRNNGLGVVVNGGAPCLIRHLESNVLVSNW